MNANGVPSSSPGLRAPRYPGNPSPRVHQPHRGCAPDLACATLPVGIGEPGGEYQPDAAELGDRRLHRQYELQGDDRAKYGSIVETLAESLTQIEVPTCDRPRRFAYVAFFRAYPRLYAVVEKSWPSLMIRALGSRAVGIVRTVSGLLENASEGEPKVRTASGQLAPCFPPSIAGETVRTSSQQR